MGVPDSALQLKHTEWKNIIWKNCVHHRLEFQRLEEPMELWSCYGVRYWSNTLLGHRMLVFFIVTFYINWNTVGTEGRIIRNIHLWNNYWINKNSDLISKIIATFYDSSREWERLRNTIQYQRHFTQNKRCYSHYGARGNVGELWKWIRFNLCGKIISAWDLVPVWS